MQSDKEIYQPCKYDPYGVSDESPDWLSVEFVEELAANVGKVNDWLRRHSKGAALVAGLMFVGLLAIANSSGRLDEIRAKALNQGFGVLILVGSCTALKLYLDEERKNADR
jgi:hypothetical protein